MKKKEKPNFFATTGFSENPEAVIVFAIGEETKLKAPSMARGSQNEEKDNSMKSIRVFSNQDFFYKEIIDLFKDEYFSATMGESFSVYKQGRYQRIIYVGLGRVGLEVEEKDTEQASFDLLEALRMNLGKIRQSLRLHKCLEIDLSDLHSIAELMKVSASKVVSAICDGLMLGSYQFDNYLTSRNKKKDYSISFVSEKESEKVAKIINEHVPLNQGVMFARDLINEPPNVMGAEAFCNHAKMLAKQSNFDIKVLSKNNLSQLKMSGILGVNAGSSEEPKLLLLEYKPKKVAKQVPELTLVGKGVTFDSGGLSLKSSKGLEEMKMDMSGAAVVLATMSVVAKVRLPIHITAAIPLTDNMPSGTALKVGSILTMYNKKTVEVLNTDAEGRLILADAIAYAIELWKPKRVIDVATLTGAVMVALGNEYAGMFSNDDEMASALIDAGIRSGEKVWQLPIHENYNKALRSEIADVKNIGGPYAGAITAAMFLKNFVGDVKWTHLDIAGVMSQSGKDGYRSAGGRGFGVRLLYDYIRGLLS